ncbi:serine transporter [Legionella lansingensis]|uniref:Serine transporter n=1 Tax=Legionella lansingensis TaxID=45067 RepID=A0A0W0VTY6_9GAMM|nr:serine/threonine transporter [Legionella lansingensis]KTD23474.1 serine transporter [Legionella lansingensis]SNV50799.1 serine transporter [Legionella lansingensis]
MSVNEITVVIPETELQVSKWQKQDRVWMLSLYGTAIGAGTLFLPINAGLNGIWPLIIMTLLAFPMTYFSHKALCRFVLSGSSPKADITTVVDEHFGRNAGRILTFLYFFAIYPILLMYSVAITNTTESFIVNQIGMQAPPRALLAIILILALMAIVRFGQDIIVKSMSMLVYPFVSILIVLSLYLIPHWNDAIFQQSNAVNGTGAHGLLMTLWLVIPVMVFSFNHSPIISSFAVTQKQRFGVDADKKSSDILKYSHIMMVITVMFFVFSCVLSLSPQDLALAKQQNISILSYLANHFHTPIMAYIAPFIAFIAIAKSFLGHYLGASEGLQGLIIKSLEGRGKTITPRNLRHLIEGFMVMTCWIVATLNPSILGMIETLGGPVIAVILFLMPMYAILTVPAMKKFRSPISNIFVTLIGLVAISAILYGLFHL